MIKKGYTIFRYIMKNEAAFFVKVDQSNFIRGRPTCDSRMLAHQTKQLPRAFLRACVCSRGRLESMMTTETFMRGLLHKEAISCRCYQRACIGGSEQRCLPTRFVVHRYRKPPQCLLLWSLRTTSAASPTPSNIAIR